MDGIPHFRPSGPRTPWTVHPGTTIPEGTIPKDAYPRIRPVPSAGCQHPLPSSCSPGVLVSGVRGGQSSFVPGGFSFSHRELEEQIATAGRDISLVSDLDWMASKLLNTMVHFLGLSTTARHANLVWHMRDSYLSKVHQLVPKATKDSLRNVSPQ